MLSHDCEIVKICDFGEARTFNTVMTAGSGTPLWMAPEVINSKETFNIQIRMFFTKGLKMALVASFLNDPQLERSIDSNLRADNF